MVGRTSQWVVATAWKAVERVQRLDGFDSLSFRLLMGSWPNWQEPVPAWAFPRARRVGEPQYTQTSIGKQKSDQGR